MSHKKLKIPKIDNLLLKFEIQKVDFEKTRFRVLKHNQREGTLLSLIDDSTGCKSEFEAEIGLKWLPRVSRFDFHQSPNVADFDPE